MIPVLQVIESSYRVNKAASVFDKPFNSFKNSNAGCQKSFTTTVFTHSPGTTQFIQTQAIDLAEGIRWNETLRSNFRRTRNVCRTVIITTMCHEAPRSLRTTSEATFSGSRDSCHCVSVCAKPGVVSTNSGTLTREAPLFALF